MRLLKILPVLILTAFILTGCGGGDSTVNNSSTTMGQELMDLDASYKKGIISEKEYKDMKEAIMDRYD